MKKILTAVGRGISAITDPITSAWHDLYKEDERCLRIAYSFTQDDALADKAIWEAIKRCEFSSEPDDGFNRHETESLILSKVEEVVLEKIHALEKPSNAQVPFLSARIYNDPSARKLFKNALKETYENDLSTKVHSAINDVMGSHRFDDLAKKPVTGLAELVLSRIQEVQEQIEGERLERVWRDSSPDRKGPGKAR